MPLRISTKSVEIDKLFTEMIDYIFVASFNLKNKKYFMSFFKN